MAELAPCGHSIGYLYRIRDMDGISRKFCFACLIEKVDIKDFNGLSPVKAKKVSEKKKKIEKPDMSDWDEPASKPVFIEKAQK